MKEYPYFPLFVDLSQTHVVVIGGGTIAKRRVLTLVDFTPSITVIAPAIHQALEPLAEQNQIRILRRVYRPTDLQGADLVIAATDDAQLNREIVQQSRAQGIPVNSASDHTLCDFFFPGIARKDNLVVGITSGGKDHHRVKELTDRIKGWLEKQTGR